LSEMKPFTYEPPKLVDFKGAQVAHGACGNGSHPSGSCGGGNVACYCSGGTSDTYTGCCGSGGCAVQQGCADGGCDATCCGSGSSQGASCCPGSCDALCAPGCAGNEWGTDGHNNYCTHGCGISC
jgi:hypothetical protein